jgi:hypothetical protein
MAVMLPGPIVDCLLAEGILKPTSSRWAACSISVLAQ